MTPPIKEYGFQKRLREGLESVGVRCYRVESHQHPGTPDIHWICAGFSGWIEVKQVAKLPTKVPYRTAQVLWAENYSAEGGRVACIMHVLSDDSVIFIHGRHARAASKELRLDTVRSTVLGGTLPWLRIRDHLLE